MRIWNWFNFDVWEVERASFISLYVYVFLAVRVCSGFLLPRPCSRGRAFFDLVWPDSTENLGPGLSLGNLDGGWMDGWFFFFRT